MNATTLEALVALARADQARRELEESLSGVPARLRRVEVEGTRLKAELSRLERELVDALKVRRQREEEAAELSARMARDAANLNSIRNNIEYQALLKQIAEARTRQTTLENEALELMEREEDLARRVKAERARVDTALGALASERATLEQEGRQLTAAVADKDNERARLLAELDSELRVRYDRLCRSKHGLAVVPVVKGACSGCFSALPLQRVNEVRLGERLVVCDACSRILIWDEEPGSP